MKLKELKSKGGLVEAGLVKKSIIWEHKDEVSGEKITDSFDIFVLRQSFGAVAEIMSQSGEGYSKASGLIAASVRLGDGGEEVLTYEQAYQLDPTLAGLFLEAVNEVNKSKAKNLPHPMSSGTS